MLDTLGLRSPTGPESEDTYDDNRPIEQATPSCSVPTRLEIETEEKRETAKRHDKEENQCK
jgi:hypothetical protein